MLQWFLLSDLTLTQPPRFSYISVGLDNQNKLYKVQFCIHSCENQQKLTKKTQGKKKSCQRNFKSASLVNLVPLTSIRQSFCSFCYYFLILLHITTGIGEGCPKVIFLPAFSSTIKIICLDLKCVNHLLCAEFSMYLYCMNHHSFLLSNCVLSHTFILVEISWPIFFSIKIRQVETQLA